LANAISDRLERLRGRLILFAPVGLGVGIGLYFALMQEPGPIGWAVIAGVAFLSLGSGLWLGRTRWPGLGLPVLAAGAVAAGL
jgi:competence protein ComEC